MMNKKFANIIAVLAIIIAIFPAIKLPILPLPTPQPSINLDVSKPDQDILNKVNAINLIVTNREDRIKLAVFNYCFSKRLKGYNTDTQKLNDIYVKAAAYYFGETMKDKYNNLDVELTKMFVDILGDKNHILSEDEKVQLHNTFGGLAWSLIQ